MYYVQNDAMVFNSVCMNS